MERGDLTRWIMRYIRKNPGVTSGQIAKAIGSEEKTTTAMLVYHVKQGRLVRSKNAGRTRYFLPQQNAAALITGLQEIHGRAKKIWGCLELTQKRCQNISNLTLAGDCEPPPQRREYCFSARLKAADARVDAKKLVQYIETILRDYDVVPEDRSDDDRNA